MHRKPPSTGSTDSPQSDPGLLAHIRALGLATVDEYVGWCSRRGFSRRLAKSEYLRARERDFVRRARAVARLARTNGEIPKSETILEMILEGQLQERDIRQSRFKAVCRAYDSTRGHRPTRRAFRDLIRNVQARADLFQVGPVVEQFGPRAGNTFVDGLLALARHSRHWIRNPTDWKPRTKNARRQFSSLARFLLTEWPVPRFMDSVWFAGDGAEANRRQRWYLHITKGESIRLADLPLRYSQKMAHHFLRAPADFTVDAALRFGQILALGGSERLARAILCTRLVSDFQNDEFWITVLRFFVAHPTLDLAQLGHIIDFIHEQKFAPQVERMGPARPNFEINNYTPARLLGQVESWRRAQEEIARSRAEWPKSGIEAFKLVEGVETSAIPKTWTVTELQSVRELVAEGRKMRHCVATYSPQCVRGDSSIWSLEVDTFEGPRKVLTVQVDNQTRRIIQARGKYNAPPGEKDLGVLRRWAAKSGLSLANEL